LAARALGGTRLAAYTARPAYPEVAAEMPDAFVDEWPTAQLLAQRYENIDHLAVDGRGVKPVAAIDHSVWVHEEPEHAGPNLPWVRALLDDARDGGARVLLSGQMGNGSVSWPGDPQHVLIALATGNVRAAGARLRHLRRASRYGAAGAIWHGIVQPIRKRVAVTRTLQHPERGPGWRDSVIAAGFANRIGLRDVVRDSGWDPDFLRAAPRERRLSYLLPGRLPTGAWWHQRSAAQGIEMRDPTADVRVLEFTVGVPEEQFARDGRDRWLARRALARVAPPEVAWHARRGAQGADIAYRLRADAGEVSAAVERVAAAGAARQYLDVRMIRASWAKVAAGSSDGALATTRGLTFGLFLLRVADGGGV
jgi:asparagine synthase (glutamine-hydrolysing)